MPMQIKNRDYYQKLFDENFIEAEDVIFAENKEIQCELVLSAIQQVLYENLNEEWDVFSDFEVGDEIRIGEKRYEVLVKEMLYPINSAERFANEPAIKARELPLPKPSKKGNPIFPVDTTIRQADARGKIQPVDEEAFAKRKQSESDVHRKLADYFGLETFYRSNPNKILIVGDKEEILESLKTMTVGPAQEKIFKYIPARRIKSTGELGMFLEEGDQSIYTSIYFASSYERAYEFLEDDGHDITQVISVLKDLKPQFKGQDQASHKHQFDFARFLLMAQERDFKVITSRATFAADLALNYVDESPIKTLRFDPFSNGEAKMIGTGSRDWRVSLDGISWWINEVQRNAQHYKKASQIFWALMSFRALLKRNRSVFAVKPERAQEFLMKWLQKEVSEKLGQYSDIIYPDLEDAVLSYVAYLPTIPESVVIQLSSNRNRNIIVSEALIPFLASLYPGAGYISDKDYLAETNYDDALIFTSFSFEQIYWSFKFPIATLIADRTSFFKYYGEKLQAFEIGFNYSIERANVSESVEETNDEGNVEEAYDEREGVIHEDENSDYPIRKAIPEVFSPLPVEEPFNYQQNTGSSVGQSYANGRQTQANITHLISGTKGELMYTSEFAKIPVIRNHKLIGTRNQTILPGDIVLDKHRESKDIYLDIVNTEPDNSDVILDQYWKDALDQIYARLNHSVRRVRERFESVGVSHSEFFYSNWSGDERPVTARKGAEFVQAIGKILNDQDLIDNYTDYYSATLNLQRVAKEQAESGYEKAFDVIPKLLNRNYRTSTLLDAVYAQGFTFMEVASIETVEEVPDGVQPNWIENFTYKPTPKKKVVRKSKTALIKEIQLKTGLTNKQAKIVVNTILAKTKESLAKEEKVQVMGFGTFSVKERKARKGINPATFERIEIPKSKMPSFKPGKKLKDAVNQRGGRNG
jgi:DNA-binding protein HU-beta